MFVISESYIGKSCLYSGYVYFCWINRRVCFFEDKLFNYFFLYLFKVVLNKSYVLYLI